MAIDSQTGTPRTLLIYCPLGQGGVAEYAHCQAKALSELGVEVRVLAGRDYLQGRLVPYPVELTLPVVPTGGPGVLRKIRHAVWLVVVPWLLAVRVWRMKPAGVLLGSYSEYLSPLWIWPHLLLRRWLGIRYGANLHDPVRDFQLGPRWWHMLSVRLAYESLDYLIVHQAELPVETVPPHVKIFEAPHGVYGTALAKSLGTRQRERWEFPPGVRVLLSFGHIRDNKNIDLLIRALPYFPTLCLVVAGPAPAGAQRPETYYRDLAEQLGVTDRFRMIIGFVADEDVSAYFGGVDWIAITYSASFRSQSGVLNVAVSARKQVLASSGPSPMRTVVERYRLGVFVEPDALESVVRGLRMLMEDPPTPDWLSYENYASWTTNARIVIAASEISTRGDAPTEFH